MANDGLSSPERTPSIVPPNRPPAIVDAQAIAGQDPSPRHIVNQPSVDLSGERPADSQKGFTGAPPSNSGTEDPEPDPEALTRATSGPVYSVFSSRMKKWIIGVVTLTSFISPMTANIYFPALNPIAHDLGVSVSLINLTLTTYMIFQGIAPTMFGDFGDMAGRRPAFIVAVLIYIVANLGLALQNNYAALLILRMVQSGGSSGTLALGYAVVADIATSSERGKYMGVVGAGINVGPSLSPVIGGLLSQYLGWRAIFWFCFLFACAVFVLYGLMVPETCRTIVGNGSVTPTGFNMTAIAWLSQKRRQRKQQKEGGGTQSVVVHLNEDGTVRQKPKLRFPNPLRALAVVFDKGVGLVIFYNSLLYLMFITTVATLSTQFKEKYGYDDLEIGLCYLPYGAGCFAAAIGQGYMLDWYYRRTAKKIGFSIDTRRGDDLSNFPIEKARIVPAYFFVAVGIVAVIIYGWVLELRPSVAAPLCLHFVIGLCITGSFGILNTLIVDLSPEAPATAVAANNFVRCEMGAAATAVIDLMISGMGAGWCFTFFALLGVVFMPILWAEGKYGIQWRREKRLRREKKLEEKRDRKERKEMEKAAAAAAVQRETTSPQE